MAVGSRRPWSDEPAEVARVLQWRYEEFRRMGFTRGDAEMLAESPCDLHDAWHLTADLCCPLHYAFLILA